MLRQPGFGREFDLAADAGGAAPVPVGGPRFGEVELPVDQRVPGRARVGEEYPDLAILDPTGGAGVLALHPGRAGALLQEPGVVDVNTPAVSPSRSTT